MKAPDSKVIDLQLASVMHRAIKDGDFSRLNGILDRCLGKVKDVVETHNHSHDRLKHEPRENLYEFIRKAASE